MYEAKIVTGDEHFRDLRGEVVMMRLKMRRFDHSLKLSPESRFGGRLVQLSCLYFHWSIL